MILAYKPVSITPLECIEEYKKEHPELHKIKIAYAGRLDPMAHGLLILLVGEETKNRDHFQSLPKIYECEMVLGIETDSYDVMGIITNITAKTEAISSMVLSDVFQKHLGKQTQAYPVFSSKTVQGKPLYWWMKHNKISEIQIPEKEIDIYDIEILKNDTIEVNKLCEASMRRVAKVKGDFRQDEIIKGWQNFALKNKRATLQKLRIKVSCSSGTYVRQLVDDIGRELQTRAIAYEIFRTKIGDYALPENITLSV